MRLELPRRDGRRHARDRRAPSPSSFAPATSWSLTGELGAGKTTFVQGSRAASGRRTTSCRRRSRSCASTAGRPRIAHVDVYRLDRVQDVVDLGLDELGDGDGVLLVEWGDAVEELLPPDHARDRADGAERRRGRAG